MTSDRATEPTFAPTHDVPVPYLQRTRDYYQALGYGAPYAWAHYAAVPFQPLAKPLRRSRLAIITTAAPFQPGKGDQGPLAPYNASAKFYAVYSGDTAREHDLRISHIAIDRTHTTAEDPAVYFPLAALRRAVVSGRIGSLGPRFHGAPTNRSHRATLDVDCPEIVARCREDAADAAILIPNCPVCHQTLSLAARMLEENGISTVVMGCAKDIVEHVGVPRFLFSDFPLGNAAGTAQRRRLAGVHARSRATLARASARVAHHGAIAAQVERESRLEARLLQHRASERGGASPPTRRIRRGESGSEANSRGSRRSEPVGPSLVIGTEAAGPCAASNDRSIMAADAPDRAFALR